MRPRISRRGWFRRLLCCALHMRALWIPGEHCGCLESTVDESLRAQRKTSTWTNEKPHNHSSIGQSGRDILPLVGLLFPPLLFLLLPLLYPSSSLSEHCTCSLFNPVCLCERVTLLLAGPMSQVLMILRNKY